MQKESSFTSIPISHSLLVHVISLSNAVHSDPLLLLLLLLSSSSSSSSSFYCYHYYYYYYHLPELQSVRRHSAIVLTVTVNDMQQIHPVIYRMGHEKVARLAFCTCPCYCINFCIYAVLRTGTTFSWLILYLLLKLNHS